MSRPLAIGGALAVALGLASVALPYLPIYDPWGWLVWGRELAHLDLATGYGMSWKPLPALLGAPLSLLGAAASEGWLAIARAGWVAAVGLAGWLAWRLAGPAPRGWRLAGAGLAAGSVALTGDSVTPAARQVAGGLSEPLLVALVLGAVAAALERRPRLTLWLGAGAALLRPEFWPFLAAWAVWECRRDRRLTPGALAAAAVIAVAWFLPDLIGAGDPLRGASTARAGGLDPLDGLEVLGRALLAPLAATWAGVAIFAWLGTRPGTRPRPKPGVRSSFVWLRQTKDERDLAAWLLLAGAFAWTALVALMAVAGFAGLPRFLAPASAAFAVVGGVGLARGGALVGPGGRRPLAAAAVATLAIALAGLGLRAAEAPGDLRHLRHQAYLVEKLDDLVDDVGRERLLACGGVVRLANLLAPPTALAWEMEEPIRSVRVNRTPLYGVVISTRALGRPPFAHSGRWRVTSLPCPSRGAAQPSSASGADIAGGSGTRR